MLENNSGGGNSIVTIGHFNKFQTFSKEEQSIVLDSMKNWNSTSKTYTIEDPEVFIQVMGGINPFLKEGKNWTHL